MHVTMHIQPQMKGKIATEESGHQTNSDSTVRVINIKHIFVMILLMWQLSKQGCYC